MRLRTVVGVVKLKVLHGQDGSDGHWGCPLRERWGLGPHQQMSQALEEKLAFTATLVPYEEAAQISRQWDCPVAASVIHQLVQRLGRKAEDQIGQRLRENPQERHPLRAATLLAILMIDGWMARFRGPGWGRQKTKRERVEWHEIKTGVFFLQEQLAQSESGRGMISDKIMVRWRGDPVELGRRLGWEALRGGMGRAQETLALADGGKWIWNLVEDRWPQAEQLLDFYHASEHVNDLALAYCGDEVSAKLWSDAHLHQMRQGQEKTFLQEIAELKRPRGERGQRVAAAQNYFASQSQRMSYKSLADQGWPIGSGPVESACRQSQCRFKRSGQFWAAKGFQHLNALDQARRNGHWDQLWSVE